MEKRNHATAAKTALFVTAIIWGGSFVVVKSAVDVFPPNLLIAIRCTISCVLLCAIFHKRLKKIDKGLLLSGALVGTAMFLGFCVQTIGILDTTPGKNAFLTAVYCVIVPFLYWALFRDRPDRFNIAAAIVCIAGIGFVSLNGDFSMGVGDALSLLSGVFFALQIALTAKFAKDRDPVLLTIIQFATASVIAWPVALLTEVFDPALVTIDSLLGMLFLAVFPTALCMLLQNIGQKYTSAATASIILSLEAVFGVVFSVIFYGEELNWRLVLGFGLIFLAVLTSITKFSFLRRPSTGTVAEALQSED